MENELNFISIAKDKESYIKNPAMGWVAYIEDCYRNVSRDIAPGGGKTIEFNAELKTICQGRTVSEYWEEFDEYYELGLKTSILYIRNGWVWFERNEGEYAWNDPSSELSLLIAGAEKRNVQLAFRVLIDTTDNSEQSVPEWVFKAGATGGIDRKSAWLKDAHINNPVFLEKFENFVKAFSLKFDNPKNVAYIDGIGAGDWGEVNNVFYDESICGLEQAVDTIIDIYNKYFHHVLLGAQYESSAGWQYAFDKGFVIRRDSLGSPHWFKQVPKDAIRKFFAEGNVLFSENCFHGLNRKLKTAGAIWEETNEVVGWPITKVLERVLDDALYCRANTLDCRMLSDMECWALDVPDGVKTFNLNCGYRLSPTSIEVPKLIEAGENIRIIHSWENTAVGRLPNNNSKWNYKYRVSFALLDTVTDSVVYQFVADKDIDPSTWIKENGEVYYTSSFKVPKNLNGGEYNFACSIVNIENENKPEINLAILNPQKTAEGWYILTGIAIK